MKFIHKKIKDCPSEEWVVKQNIFWSFLVFLIMLCVLGVFIFWLFTGFTTEPSENIDLTPAAIAETVSVNDTGDSVVIPDPCTLDNVDCPWIDGGASPK